MGSNMFTYVNLAACTLYVPYGTLADYESVGSPWSSFGTRYELPDNQQRSVTFNARGGTLVPMQTVTLNGRATEPDEPTHYGYTFGGWYTDELCTTAWDFNNVVTANTTLYAKWNGGSCSGSGFTAYGTMGAMGWSLCSGTLTISGEGNMPSSYPAPWYTTHRSSITSVTFDSRITSIGSSAFVGCTNLTSVAIPNSITRIGVYAFSGCTGLTSLTIGGYVTSLEQGAFYGCTGLSSVTIPSSVTTIYANVFNSCTGLISVTIGSGVTYLDENAFGYCTALDTIVSLPLTPPTSLWYTPFTNVPSTCCLYVPAAALGAYSTAAHWSNFTCRKAIPGSYYTVTFDTRGGSSVGAQQVAYGSTMSPPGNPTRPYYVFGGWCKDTACTQTWNFAVDVVASNITLYARWVQIFTVNFDSQGGSPTPAAQNVQEGQAVQQPSTNPIRSSYLFGGWYREQACIVQWNFATDVVQQPTVLYAKWIPLYTVTFDAQGGSPSLTTQTLQHGQKAQQPAAPTYASHNFAGWYTSTSYTTAWSFASDIITANTTLYAKWISTSATIDTVTFNSNGGSAVLAQQVVRGGTAAQPGNPTNEGFTFGGWFTDQACTVGNEWNFGAAVSGSITLYALWECTVLFNSNGGSGVPKQVVRAGSKLIEPTPPTRHGRPFLGWYNHLCLEPQFKWNFSTDTVQGDMMLYGSWTQNP